MSERERERDGMNHENVAFESISHLIFQIAMAAVPTKIVCAALLANLKCGRMG